MVFIKFSALRSFNETQEKNYHNIPCQNIILITGSLKLMEKNQVRQWLDCKNVRSRFFPEVYRFGFFHIFTIQIFPKIAKILKT